jgi:hypothetical protein
MIAAGRGGLGLGLDKKNARMHAVDDHRRKDVCSLNLLPSSNGWLLREQRLTASKFSFLGRHRLSAKAR